MCIVSANVPDELRVLRQWLLWRREIRDGKPTKVPVTTMGFHASITNPGHWSTFGCALQAAARTRFCDGVGFVFTEGDPYCGIDLDNIWQSDADEGATWAAGILKRFENTYSEVSPSGKGVKLWCKATVTRCRRWPFEAGAIEIYDHARFFTVTGRSAGITNLADHQSDVEALVARLDQGRHYAQSRVIPNVIPQGRRHTTLVSLAGSMWKRGMCEDAIEAALLETNRRQCDPPYDAEHIHQIVQSMRKKWSR
jgi:primase-polymerase (primpol)-like protein